jgi:NTE family protein
MAEMYWQEPDNVNPACFARASASIPIFFQPYTVSGISPLISSVGKWKQLDGFSGALPNKASFADGGMLSAIPIDLYKRPGVPRAPTLGVRLKNKSYAVKDIEKLGQYADRLFIALRDYSDHDFIYRNPLYNSLIAHINTDGYNWLDFNMGYKDKLGLFREGALAGHNFLESFDWARYKELRAAEYEMHCRIK